MMPVPDPTSIDFVGIAGWGSGIALVAGSIFVTLRGALKSAGRVAANLPPTVHTTDVYTTDSLAMQELAGVISALNVSVRDLHLMLKTEIEARSFEDKVEEEVQRRLAEARKVP